MSYFAKEVVLEVPTAVGRVRIHVDTCSKNVFVDGASEVSVSYNFVVGQDGRATRSTLPEGDRLPESDLLVARTRIRGEELETEHCRGIGGPWSSRGREPRMTTYVDGRQRRIETRFSLEGHICGEHFVAQLRYPEAPEG